MKKDFEYKKDFIDYTSPCIEWKTRKTGEKYSKIPTTNNNFSHHLIKKTFLLL